MVFFSSLFLHYRHEVIDKDGAGWTIKTGSMPVRPEGFQSSVLYTV
jgi:hypothetical protein